MISSRYSRLKTPRAFSGVARRPPGSALAAAPMSSPFIDRYVPMLWQTEIAIFGSSADYWVDGSQAQSVTLTLIWKDGAADEEVSPGRYSHALIRNLDLPRVPKKGDVITKDGAYYDVVMVYAYTYEICTVVLQETEPANVLTWDQIPGTWDSIPGTFDSAGNI